MSAAAAPTPTTTTTSTETTEGPVARRIRETLATTFAPVEHLEVNNESHMHAVPRGSESHFKVVVVSAAFEGKTPVERHRAVNTALAGEFAKGLHALSVVAKTPKQWSANSVVEPSPNCLGGSKHDAREARKANV